MIGPFPIKTCLSAHYCMYIHTNVTYMYVVVLVLPRPHVYHIDNGCVYGTAVGYENLSSPDFEPVGTNFRTPYSTLTPPQLTTTTFYSLRHHEPYLTARVITQPIRETSTKRKT